MCNFASKWQVLFVLRHLRRNFAKSTLAFGLCTFAVVAVGWLSHTITVAKHELDNLINTTVVTAKTARCPSNTFRPGPMDNTLSIQSVNELRNSPFVLETYVEAGFLWQFLWPADDEGAFDYASWNEFEIPLDWEHYTDWIIAVSDLDGFVRRNTRLEIHDQLGVVGTSIRIEFADGFSADDFVFREGESTPVIVSENLPLLRGVETGGIAYTAGDLLHAPLQIIGTFSGGLQPNLPRGRNSQSNIIMPLEAFIGLRGYDSGFLVTALTLDPLRNRELHHLQTFANRMLSHNSIRLLFGVRNLVVIPYILEIHDSELRETMEAINSNIAFLEQLFPYAVAGDVIISVMLAFLLAWLNTKNGAILRALGVDKRAVQVVGVAGHCLVAFFGSIVGFAVLIILGANAHAMLPLAAVCLLSSILGSGIGMILVSRKTPIDLLQVRE